MTSRSITQVFDQYQRARLHFAQTVADLASRQQNVELMEKENVLELLKPLVNDPCPSIKQCASIAIGRLVDNDVVLAGDLIKLGILPLIINNIPEGNKFQRASALFVLRAVCRHNEKLAENVIKIGGLQTFVFCLEDFEAVVKEAAAWGIGYVARHSKTLAQECVDHGAVPLLMLCLQEPELSLKQITTNAISDIAKHSEDLAIAVVDAGILPSLVKNLGDSDEKLKRQCLVALSSCAKHSVELAEVVVEAEIFPTVLEHLTHPCNSVRRSAACLVRDICKHSLELTQLVVNTGGIGALLEILFRPLTQPQDGLNDARIPAVSALGFVAGQSGQLAMTVIGCRTVQVLGQILNESPDDSLLAVTAWAVGQVGKHSPEHSQAVAAASIFPRLVELYQSGDASEDLRSKCQNALKICLQNCLLVSALEPLLWVVPPEILKYVLGQYSKVLPNDPKARRLFVTSGSLKKVQEIDAKPGTVLMEYITVINSCFPEEIVRYYSPGYPDTLLEKVEQYSPQMMTVLRESGRTSEDVQTELLQAVVKDEMTSDNDTIGDVAGD